MVMTKGDALSGGGGGGDGKVMAGSGGREKLINKISDPARLLAMVFSLRFCVKSEQYIFSRRLFVIVALFLVICLLLSLFFSLISSFHNSPFIVH